MNWKEKRYWLRKGAKVKIYYLEDGEYAGLEIGDVLYLHSEKFDSNGDVEGWYFTKNPDDKEMCMDHMEPAYLLLEEFERYTE